MPRLTRSHSDTAVNDMRSYGNALQHSDIDNCFSDHEDNHVSQPSRVTAQTEVIMNILMKELKQHADEVSQHSDSSANEDLTSRSLGQRILTKRKKEKLMKKIKNPSTFAIFKDDFKASLSSTLKRKTSKIKNIKSSENIDKGRSSSSLNALKSNNIVRKLSDLTISKKPHLDKFKHKSPASSQDDLHFDMEMDDSESGNTELELDDDQELSGLPGPDRGVPSRLENMAGSSVRSGASNMSVPDSGLQSPTYRSCDISSPRETESGYFGDDSRHDFISDSDFIEVDHLLNQSKVNDAEAVKAIIDAINRMADKIENDPKLSSSLRDTARQMVRNSMSFSSFQNVIKRLAEDTSHNFFSGTGVESWGQVFFLLILSKKLVEHKYYPLEFFKRYVYDKIVPWVSAQPEGWVSARYDQRVGSAIQRAEGRVLNNPNMSHISEQGSSPSTPSSILGWLGIGRRESDTSRHSL